MSGVRLVINMHAKPGQADAYAEAWAPKYAEVNAEPGCLQYELFRSTVNPDNVAILEWWEDKAAFDRHFAVERTRTPIAPDLVGRSDERRVGRNTMEIYWDQCSYRFDPGSGAWVPR